jgi:hypothetical protein
VWRWRFSVVLRVLIVVLPAAAATLLLVLVVAGEPEDVAYFETGAWVLLGFGALAFVAEYIDTSVGMGFGSIVAPVLVVAGFEPVEILAAVFVSEAATGLAAGALHHRAANVDLGRGSRDRKTVLIVALPAAGATALAAAVTTTLDVGVGEVVIGVVVLVAGVFVLAGRRVLGGVSWRTVGVLGVVAAIAKGLSGSGFGPIATAGQIGIGIPERNAVGVTSVAEGLASAAGLAVIVAVEGWPSVRLVGSVGIGALLAVPLGVWTVRLMPGRIVRAAVGGGACFLGLLAVLSVAIG